MIRSFVDDGGPPSNAEGLAGGGDFHGHLRDGVADIDINKLVAFHKSHGTLATVTAVSPPARFAGLVLDGNTVSSFAEKAAELEARHEGFWHPMDTRRDRNYLEGLWATGKAP